MEFTICGTCACRACPGCRRREMRRISWPKRRAIRRRWLRWRERSADCSSPRWGRNPSLTCSCPRTGGTLPADETKVAFRWAKGGCSRGREGRITPSSGKDFFDDPGLLDSGQFLFEAVALVEESFVVEPQKVQDRGVPFGHADAVFDCHESDLVGRSVDGPRFDSRPGQPAGKGVFVVVTSGGHRFVAAAELGDRQTAEFPSPQHQHAVQQPARLEVL